MAHVQRLIDARRGAHRHRVVIGKDTRLSGYMLDNAMVAGFTSAVNGLAGGLAGDAEAMRATGANYAAQEAANARGGATLRQA